METSAKAANFRNYDEGETIATVRENYRKMRTNQTVEYVRRMRNKYLAFDKPMHIWEAMEKLNVFVDLSDPDMNLPNLHHLVQTAEGMRADNRPDWMQLVGLIHDLGKCMFLWGKDEDGTSMNEQWETTTQRVCEKSAELYEEIAAYSNSQALALLQDNKNNPESTKPIQQLEAAWIVQIAAFVIANLIDIDINLPI